MSPMSRLQPVGTSKKLTNICIVRLKRGGKRFRHVVSGALAGAGLPLYRFPVRRQYDRAEIARVIGSRTARAPKVSSEGSG